MVVCYNSIAGCACLLAGSSLRGHSNVLADNKTDRRCLCWYSYVQVPIQLLFAISRTTKTNTCLPRPPPHTDRPRLYPVPNQLTHLSQYFKIFDSIQMAVLVLYCCCRASLVICLPCSCSSVWLDHTDFVPGFNHTLASCSRFAICKLAGNWMLSTRRWYGNKYLL